MEKHKQDARSKQIRTIAMGECSNTKSKTTEITSQGYSDKKNRGIQTVVTLLLKLKQERVLQNRSIVPDIYQVSQ